MSVLVPPASPLQTPPAANTSSANTYTQEQLRRWLKNIFEELLLVKAHGCTFPMDGAGGHSLTPPPPHFRGRLPHDMALDRMNSSYARRSLDTHK